MSSLSLNSPSIMTPAPSAITRSMSDIGSFAGSESSAFKSGWAKVKEEGGFMKGGLFWSEKFLVLREKQLDFQKGENTPKVAFSIPLKDVLNVSRSDVYPFAFELIRALGVAPQSMPPRDGPQKSLICKFETDNDVYSWIDVIQNKCPSMGGVSHPTGFSHRVHVGFDQVTGGFVGLPTEWQRLLNSSALTQDDMRKNPDAIVEVLKFYANNMKGSEDNLSSTPTPPTDANGQKQLGYAAGSSIAPPRGPAAPAFNRQESFNTSNRTASPATSQFPAPLRANTTDQRAEDDRRRKTEEERRRKDMLQRQREEDDRRAKQELDEYNASLPQTRLPMAKQELGGYNGEGKEATPSPARYNPSRPAPPTPNGGLKDPARAPAGPPRQLTATRSAPAPPVTNGISAFPKPAQTKVQLASAAQQRSPPEGRQPASSNGQGSAYPPSNGPKYMPSSSSSGSNAVKPLNVAAKQASPAQVDSIKQAELALTAPGKKEESPRKEVRMSSMTDAQVMERLREVVSKDRPLDSYNKQKKIGQGASGSVYVARVRESAPSPVARQLLRDNGPKCQVAIKQMDLRNQPRKELIVNEIIVMKDSKHPNIVNFLDAFLQEENNELWVVMEFMEGGALTDVIDNNSSISEEQISTICFEVSC